MLLQNIWLKKKLDIPFVFTLFCYKTTLCPFSPWFDRQFTDILGDCIISICVDSHWSTYRTYINWYYNIWLV